VGVSGATGAIFAIRLLEVLRAQPDVESHLILTSAARQTIALETNVPVREVEELADFSYRINDIAAAPSSGSFRIDGMVIVPCSMNTLGAIANGVSDNLLLRAADVSLKERRRLVLVARETPLHLGHLRNMVSATESGAVVMPPVPAFYHRPTTIEQVVDQTVQRIVDQLAIRLSTELFPRWVGAAYGRAKGPE
jgi:4-hydroxy-3-polyprenylbenzoate decarboxylase